MRKITTIFRDYSHYITRGANRLIVYALLAGSLGACKKHTSPSNPPDVKPDSPLTIALIHTLPAILKESSGLCFTDGNLWTFGDSGNPNAIFKIDTTSGAVLQTVTVQNFPNEDWEDITADSSYIYIGDFGNNDGNRKDLKIIRIKKSSLNTDSSQVNVNGDAINFSYADQTSFNTNSNTNFDCEALVSIENHLYIFTKDGGDLQTRCYKLPKDTGTYSVSPISTFNTQGKITSAAYNPITKELALGGYMNKKVFPFIWFFKNYTGDNFFNGASLRRQLSNNNTVWQTEGLDYTGPNSMFLSCESSNQVAASLFSIALKLSYP